MSDEEYVTQLNDFDDYGKSEAKLLLDNFSNLIEQQVSDSQVIVPNYGPLSDSLRVNAFRDEDLWSVRVIHQIKALSANYFSAFNIPMY